MHVLCRGSDREDVGLSGYTARGPGPSAGGTAGMAPLEQLSVRGRVTRPVTIRYPKPCSLGKHHTSVYISTLRALRKKPDEAAAVGADPGRSVGISRE